MKLATINFWGIPNPLSVDRIDRLKKLINLITREKIDIVALQEMWLKSDIEYVEKKLSQYYSLHCAKRKYNRTGLMILSKYKFSAQRFLPIKSTDYSFWTKKGLLIGEIKIKERYVIINTHLYCTLRPLKSKIWRNQINHLLTNIPNSKSFILGDFNYNYASLPLPGLKIISKTNMLTRNKINYYAKRRLNKFGMEMTCDLILCNFDAKVISQEIIIKPLISDHYPVITKIKV